jgi:hypothetical protein
VVRVGVRTSGFGLSSRTLGSDFRVGLWGRTFESDFRGLHILIPRYHLNEIVITHMVLPVLTIDHVDRFDRLYIFYANLYNM